MENPWLSIPLDDYEGHMKLPAVAQADLLATALADLIGRFDASSVAVVGCAGGNGFDAAARSGVTRLVGLDINQAYIDEARTRYAGRLPGLALHVADIEAGIPPFHPVDLVYGALVFEYVDIARSLRNLWEICRPGGILAALLQLPNDRIAHVTPSPFVSLAGLSAIMRLVPPKRFRDVAEGTGFGFLSQTRMTLPSGKQFSLLVFRRPYPDDEASAP